VDHTHVYQVIFSKKQPIGASQLSSHPGQTSCLSPVGIATGVFRGNTENLHRKYRVTIKEIDTFMAPTCWPSRSPDLTPCDFFLWRYIKDRIFVHPLSVSLNELKQSMTTAVASVDEGMLRSVWTELEYCIDICCVTKGSHIEHL
jgi:hypothetical protein